MDCGVLRRCGGLLREVLGGHGVCDCLVVVGDVGFIWWAEEGL